VDRAIVTVEKALELYGAPLYVRKEIVHNKHVVSTLEQKGVIFVNETDEVPEGQTVVFSAHGVSPAVHAEAARRNLKTIDATCPLVTKVHNEVKRFASDDTEILLIGHAGHEEVEGTAGEAPGQVRVIDGLDGARNVVPTPGKNLIWLTQTTLSVDETMQSVKILRERFPEIASPPSDDICYATQNRQEAIRAIAAQSDLVLVVGSTNSSNSVRLVEVALEYGAKASYLVDYASEANDEWLVGVETVGVTSGASVPEELVQELLNWLYMHGFHDQQEVEAKKESLTFALPQELRADIKSAGK
jgi:4-hydroxy-3-methylbut-2-enyl diphosphate reductase